MNDGEASDDVPEAGSLHLDLMSQTDTSVA